MQLSSSPDGTYPAYGSSSERKFTNKIYAFSGMKILYTGEYNHSNAMALTVYNSDDEVIDFVGNTQTTNFYLDYIMPENVSYFIISGYSNKAYFLNARLLVHNDDLEKFYILNNNLMPDYTAKSSYLESLYNFIANATSIPECDIETRNTEEISSNHFKIYNLGYHFLRFKLSDLPDPTKPFIIYIEIDSPIENYALKEASTSSTNMSTAANLKVLTPTTQIGTIYKYVLIYNVQNYIAANRDYLIIRCDGRDINHSGDIPSQLTEDQVIDVKWKACQKDITHANSTSTAEAVDLSNYTTKQDLIYNLLNTSNKYVNEYNININNSTMLGNRYYKMNSGGYCFVHYNLQELYDNNIEHLYIYIEVDTPEEEYVLKCNRTDIDDPNTGASTKFSIRSYEHIGTIYKYFLDVNIFEYVNAGRTLFIIRGDARGSTNGDNSRNLENDEFITIKWKAVCNYLGFFSTNNTSSTEGSLEKIAYISTTGSDNNDGSISSPLLTARQALINGATKLIFDTGVYTNVYNLPVTRSITICKQQLDGSVVFKYPSVITNTESKMNDYTKVYTADSPNLSSIGKYIYQDAIPDEATLIDNNERLPQQRGLRTRLQDTRILKCTATTLEEALAEIESSTDYKWYYESNKVYFSRPSEVNETNNLMYPTSNNLFRFDTINNTHTIKMSGINVKYMCVNIIGTLNSEIADCSSVNAFGAGCFRYDEAINAKFIRCEAASCMTAGTTGDGFNGHGSNTGDPYAKQVTCSLIDCWSHDNNDDGYSDHERSEIVIHGGLYEYNGKGGITPSYGSHCSCYNVISRYNYAGFYYIGSAATAEGGMYGQMLCIGCHAEYNTRGGKQCGFVIDGNKNRMLLKDCTSIGNGIAGYKCDSTNVVKMINCGSLNETPTSFASGSTIEIINTNNVTA